MFGFAFPVHFLILQASPNLWKTKWYLFLLKTCARLTNTFCCSVKCVDNILAPPSVWLKPTTGIGAKFCLTEQHSESKMKCVSYKMCSIWTITTNAKCVKTQTETQIDKLASDLHFFLCTGKMQNIRLLMKFVVTAVVASYVLMATSTQWT